MIYFIFILCIFDLGVVQYRKFNLVCTLNRSKFKKLSIFQNRLPINKIKKLRTSGNFYSLFNKINFILLVQIKNNYRRYWKFPLNVNLVFSIHNTYNNFQNCLTLFQLIHFNFHFFF